MSGGSGQDIRFQQLKQRYIDSMPDKLRDITAAWQAAQARNFAPQACAELKIQVHRIAGSGGGYGFNQLSATATTAERRLIEVMDHNASHAPLMQALQALCDEITALSEQEGRG